MDHVFATDDRIIGNVSLKAGEHWPADDPIVLAYPQFFTADARFGLRSTRPLDADGYPIEAEAPKKRAPKKRAAEAVEQTTAAPGEKRHRSK